MKQLLALIGDAHTNIAFVPSAHDYMRPLPISLLIINGAWYVRFIDKAYEKYLGWQVIAINDIPIQEVYSRAAQIISGENQTAMEERFAAEISFIDALKYLNVTDDLTTARFTLKNISTGLNETIEIPSYKGADIFNAEIVSWQTKSTPTSQTDDMYRSMELNQDTYFIQYNICAEDEAYSIAMFAEQIQADLASNDYAKVVVDLRYNGGGNSAVLKPVIDMLQKRQKERHYDVYTLIGRATYSSAVLTAIELKERLNCIFVGTPTKGNLNHYGEVETFNLPTFPARIAYSTKYFEFVPGYEKDSIYPDIPVTTSYDDVVAGVDREVQVIMAE